MRDNMKPCQHTLSDDVVYKEVVVIGNGPSGMVTSFMLAGNVPYLKEIPEDLPIDEMLRARLSNLPPGQNLFEADLMALAEGLEGRSHNPIPLLMDNLLLPCADLGIQADSLIEWRFDIEKQVEHVVLGRGPAGGAWHTFPAHVHTLSPAAWLALPPHAPHAPLAPLSPLAPPRAPSARLPARAHAAYCRRYVRALRLQRYFRTDVVVSSVTRLPRAACTAPACPRGAAFSVTGYDKAAGRPFRYVCRRVVLACGGGDRPNTLAPPVPAHALHALGDVERAIAALQAAPPEWAPAAAVLVVGSGVSAADAVRLARRAALPALHLHRAPAAALARLSPRAYPDYCQIYDMMCDGPAGEHANYRSYPDHMIVDVTPLHDYPQTDDDVIRPKLVKLLNLVTNETVDVTVSLIAVLIGSRPDLFFLQTNFNLNCIDVKECTKCIDEPKHAAKRKIEDDQKQCFLKNHWYYLKSVLGQSIQSCKSRYLNYTEINGNTGEKCVIPDCNKIDEKKCSCLISEFENGTVKTKLKDCDCDVIPYSEPESNKCTCQENPYSGGIGFGVDPTKPVDGRANPIAIDKSTHELLNAPKGMYALGPLTADNFVRFISGGALAIVSSIHKEVKE